MSHIQAFFPRGRFFHCATIAFLLLSASACRAQITPASQSPQAALSSELDKYPGLLAEFGQLFARLEQSVQFPPARSKSPLLPLLPESTMSYAALPNYGDAAYQALEIFRQELQASSVLRDWWQHGSFAAHGSKLEHSLEKFYRLHQYLGDEIIISGVTDGREPRLLVIAAVRKPGLKKFLQETINELAGESKSGVRVLDLQELPAAKDKGSPDELEVLVRPDFLVAALDLATLRSFNARIERQSRDFTVTPFGQRVAQEYQGGVTVLAAADLRKILSQVPSNPKQDAAFQRSGFADLKYLVWDRKTVAGRSISQSELTFTAPRRGAAAWLAKSGPLNSLDFVSPDAILAGTLALASPAQILEDVKALAAPSNPFAAVAQAEQALNLSLKDDLLGLLTGELTLELDSLAPPAPQWKALFGVKDVKHLQQTLSTLLALARFPSEDFEDAGVSYHTVRVPARQATLDVGYAFVDGYLVIGSGRKAVAQAVQLHKSGGALAKSAAFLASLPSGKSLNASALLYEDPIALAALQLQRLAPDLAQSLLQAKHAVPPAVVSVYGEESSIRETSTSAAFDVGGILIVAAIAIPNLLRSKMAANEASAVGSVRVINTAQITYASTYPQRGYAPDLATLGPDPREPAAYSAHHAGLLDGTLGNESCAEGAWCTKSGYRFRVTAVCKKRVCEEYVTVATPVDTNGGARSFCSTSDAIIHMKLGPVDSPPTPAECKAWQPLQ